MPSIVGGIKIDFVGEGTFSVGDTFRLSPSGTSQDRGGEGSFNTGDFLLVIDKKSITNVNDPDISDQFSLSIKPLIK